MNEPLVTSRERLAYYPIRLRLLSHVSGSNVKHNIYVISIEILTISVFGLRKGRKLAEKRLAFI